MAGSIQVVITLDASSLSLLRDMSERLIRIERMGIKMADSIDTILSDVQDEATVDQSIIVLLDGINAQLKAAGTDPAKIAAVRSAIAANKAAIVAAVLRNTSVVAATGPTVIPASVSVSNGSSVQLSVDDASGTDITASASYSSADDTTASVNPQGVVTGNKVGTTNVTVTDANGNATKVPVTVS
jgi:hypothetical protein